MIQPCVTYGASTGPLTADEVEEPALGAAPLQWHLTLDTACFQPGDSPEPFCSKLSLGLDHIDTDGVADTLGPPELELILSGSKCRPQSALLA